MCVCIHPWGHLIGYQPYEQCLTAPILVGCRLSFRHRQAVCALRRPAVLRSAYAPSTVSECEVTTSQPNVDRHCRVLHQDCRVLQMPRMICIDIEDKCGMREREDCSLSKHSDERVELPVRRCLKKCQQHPVCALECLRAKEHRGRCDCLKPHVLYPYPHVPYPRQATCLTQICAAILRLAPSRCVRKLRQYVGF